MEFEFAAFALEHPAAERWGYQRSATRVAEQPQGSLSNWAHVKTHALSYIEYAFSGCTYPRTPMTPGSPGSMATVRRCSDRPTEHYM